MTSIININGDLTIIYLALSLLCLWLIIKKTDKFNGQDLINSLLRLTNKIILFTMFITFVFMSVFSIINPLDEKIITFFKANTFLLIYYLAINYGVYYLLKFIDWCIFFVKENDLMNLSYFNKEVNRGNNKK